MNIRLLIIAIIVVVSLAVSGCMSGENRANATDNSTGDVQYLTFTSHLRNFTIKYPIDWTVDERPDGSYLAFIYPPRNASTGDYDGKLEIYRTLSWNGPVGLAGAKNNLDLFMSDWFRGDNFSHKNTTLSNLPAIEYDYTGWSINPINRTPSEKSIYMEIITVAGDARFAKGDISTIIYSVRYGEKESTNGKYLNEARYMIGSFNITGTG